MPACVANAVVEPSARVVHCLGAGVEVGAAAPDLIVLGGVSTLVAWMAVSLASHGARPWGRRGCRSSGFEFGCRLSALVARVAESAAHLLRGLVAGLCIDDV
jgi:hypothetical protein